MAWAVFTREFNWSRLQSKFSFNVQPSSLPQSRVHDLVDAAVAAGAAYRVPPPAQRSSARRQTPTSPAIERGFSLEAFMAVKAGTAQFHQMVLEVETDTPGTFVRICGLTGRGIERTHNMSVTAVPYCDDESLPAANERAVESSDVTISATGVWARQSHELMLDWWYGGQTKIIRIQHANADVGDTEYETGPAYLTSIGNQAERGGGKVTAELSIEFDGIPTRTPKA